MASDLHDEIDPLCKFLGFGSTICSSHDDSVAARVLEMCLDLEDLIEVTFDYDLP